ncbi:MAG TPA: hypothetical protein VJ842_09690 [Pyrinomonadaceae bacterium]|nr:hypothetical protein [Pyrinomonadaceae bacterium]
MTVRPHAKILTLTALLIFSCVAEAFGQGRIRPPDSVTAKCDPNHLTSFTGTVLSYSRSASRIYLRMRTDEETTESFTLKFARGADATKSFLLNGEEFKASDWSLIERSRYRLRPRMRATVWVCDDKSNPTIDWRPRERKSGAVY